MNKAELAENLSKQCGLSKAVAGRVLDSVINTVTTEVAKGGSVTLIGFGTFGSAKRAARTGRNPVTGDKIKIAATVVPKFKPGAAFRAAVAKGARKRK